MAASLSSAVGLSAFDVIMPCSSMYHATAWGLPFTAAINGCKLVLPCDRMDGASLADLINEEGVTFSGGVPTIWRSEEHTSELQSLMRISYAVFCLKKKKRKNSIHTSERQV